MTRVLFVDDEPMILRGLRRLLFRTEMDVEIATSGDEALEHLASRPFDVLVTDIRMPGMDGNELLERARRKYPETIRMVLSAQPDEGAAIRAAGLAHRFLSKPCSGAALTGALKRAQTVACRLRAPPLRRAVAELPNLPSLPHVYTQLRDMMNNEMATADKVAEVVQQDPGISAKLLRLVNSSFYASAQEIETVRAAVVRLGFRLVRNLVMAAGVFDASASVPAGFLDELQRHSLETAAHASALGESPEQRDELFLAGLLHDIGVLVMIQANPNSWNVLRHDRDPGREKEEFGASHAELGAYLLSLWGLPHDFVEAALHHHDGIIHHLQSDGISEKVYYAECRVRNRMPDPEFAEAMGQETLERWDQALAQRSL